MPPKRQPAGRAKPARLKSAGAPRLDATNVAGLTSLMNVQNLDRDVDLEAAERDVMGRGEARHERPARETDPVRIYTQELNALAGELGLDLLDGAEAEGALPDENMNAPSAPSPARGFVRPAATKVATRSVSSKPVLRRAGVDDLIDDLDLSGSETDESYSEDDSDSDYDSDSDSGTDETETGSSGDETGSSGEYSDSDYSSSDDDSVLSALEKDLGIDLDSERRKSKRRRRVQKIDAPYEGGRRLKHLTEEQERRQHLDSVMMDMRHETRTTFGVERERSQDMKANKLEQIAQLKMTLEEEGIDCTAVGAPTTGSPMDEIDSVLNVLRMKNDRNRYSSLAEEVILGAAEGVETVLDGTRAVPIVGWRPDYTGYHNTVNVKLHRMRFETSQVVGDIIQKYNISPTSRIIMELLPSFLLYPRQQRRQRGTPGLHDDPAAGGRRNPDPRNAFMAIRNSDTPEDLRRDTDVAAAI